jgi:hypothetical protein
MRTINIDLDRGNFVWLEQEAAAQGISTELMADACLESHILRAKNLRGTPLQSIGEHIREAEKGYHQLFYSPDKRPSLVKIEVT